MVNNVFFVFFRFFIIFFSQFIIQTILVFPLREEFFYQVCRIVNFSFALIRAIEDIISSTEEEKKSGRTFSKPRRTPDMAYTCDNHTCKRYGSDILFRFFLI